MHFVLHYDTVCPSFSVPGWNHSIICLTTFHVYYWSRSSRYRSSVLRFSNVSTPRLLSEPQFSLLVFSRRSSGPGVHVPYYPLNLFGLGLSLEWENQSEEEVKVVEEDVFRFVEAPQPVGVVLTGVEVSVSKSSVPVEPLGESHRTFSPSLNTRDGLGVVSNVWGSRFRFTLSFWLRVTRRPFQLAFLFVFERDPVRTPLVS